ncbi:MAG: 3-hydroxyacyl-CoA dehydrogenase/enoyl-CoA hydratase family protein, partial [Clostridia bacterium]|nr:3-hydroxyacyl-CoA dehydrogenase/enoyl-CoA hydratase family protein [Clostridia bacterium]
YSKNDARLVKVGNFEDHLHWLSDVDWIIEVVVERLDIKKDLLQKIAVHRKPGTIVSSNTSGISINKMVENMPEEFRQHFLGTHFFNPPRYMKLLEIIPCNDTLPEIVDGMVEFGEKVLGKGVVIAKDTPNFIANRIGTYGMLETTRIMLEDGYTVEEVDVVSGPAMGRPKSASFRTLDLVGLDTFLHVANNVLENVDDPFEKEAFKIPELLKTMVDKGLLGNKTKQGFYTKQKTEQGKQILYLNYQTMEYEPIVKPKFASIEAGKNIPGLANRIKNIINAKDRAGELAWKTLKKTLLYSARQLGIIADDIPSIDKAMKWGFNWSLGPFEVWDAIGVEKSVVRMKEEGEEIPAVIEEFLGKGNQTFYMKNDEGLFYYDFVSKEYKLLEEPKELIVLKELKKQNKVVHSNAGAALIDLGDGVACLEFTSPNNALGVDIIQMINWCTQNLTKNFDGMVIGNQGKNFCVGANLMLILMEAEDENWDEIELMIREFQYSFYRMKYAPFPVVAAPFGMTLGGGYEISAAADKIQAAGETYMGLVELGVGLVPGAGGHKELLLRHMEKVDNVDKIDIQPIVNKVFETIAMAKVSTSAKEAKDLGYMRASDGISVNSDFLLHDAKNAVLEMVKQGYRPPAPAMVPVVGESGYAVMELGIYTLLKGGYISEYDAFLAKKVAHILSGGKVHAGTVVSEEYLLDVEREVFLSLVGEPKSQDRMRHMLLKGKPLRN